MNRVMIKWTMTSFKFSDATRAMIGRVRDARNKANVPDWYKQHLTNTDVIRQLLQEECARLDAADKAPIVDAKPAKKTTAKKIKHFNNKPKAK